MQDVRDKSKGSASEYFTPFLIRSISLFILMRAFPFYFFLYFFYFCMFVFFGSIYFPLYVCLFFPNGLYPLLPLGCVGRDAMSASSIQPLSLCISNGG